LTIIVSFNIAYNTFLISNFSFSPQIPENSIQKYAHLEVSFNKKDIYYIVLDEYASLKSLKELYNYSNHIFIKELENLGFFHAYKSKTNYSLTQYSIAASLNMTLLNKKDDPYKMLRSNLVCSLLKKYGYTIIEFPINNNANFDLTDLRFDFDKKEKNSTLNDFYLFLLERSMLKFLYYKIVNSGDYGDYFRKKILDIFIQLEKITKIKGPKFTYVHVNCPHWPYVFDRKGNKVSPKNYFNIKNKKYYLDQYLFISDKTLEIVRNIIEKSDHTPIMIIQSDHGPRGTVPKNNGFRMNVGMNWQSIFNALLLPDIDSQILRRDLPPTETFRFIFKHYFALEIDKNP
jgi:hypothetical protein